MEQEHFPLYECNLSDLYTAYKLNYSAYTSNETILNQCINSTIYDAESNAQIVDFLAENRNLPSKAIEVIEDSFKELKTKPTAALFVAYRLKQMSIDVDIDDLEQYLNSANAKERALAKQLFSYSFFESTSTNATINDNENLNTTTKLVEKLGWNLQTIQNKQLSERLLFKLAVYSISPDDIDRYGNTASELLKLNDSEGISRLIFDNHFFPVEDIYTLLKRFAALNDENIVIQKLIKDSYFETTFRKIKKIQKKLDIEDYQAWSQSVFGESDKLLEIIAVLSEVMEETVGLEPRDVQILSLLTLLRYDSGALASISTGEGKSLIIAMFAGIKALLGYSVDIITTAPNLAHRDALKFSPFFAKLGIGLTHNVGTDYSTEGIMKPLYRANIVYGTMHYFIADRLKKQGRGLDVVIIDEVDNLLLDSNGVKIQLARGLPGAESVNPAFMYMYGQIANVISLLSVNDTQAYIVNPQTGTHEFVTRNLSDYLVNITRNYSRDVLFDSSNTLRHERPLLIPHFLEEFTQDQQKNWANSVITALKFREDIEYVVHRPSSYMQYSFSLIAPVEWSSTGVIQENMEWSDGLHQLLQAKHLLSMKTETVMATFLSYIGFIKKYKGSIYGLTGTLGLSSHKAFLKREYHVDSVIIPTFAYKSLIEYPSIVVLTSEELAKALSTTIDDITKDSRALLIVFQTILQVKNFHQSLLESGYNASKIFEYGTGNSAEGEMIKRAFTAGDILIGTNLAGRGLDIKLNNEVLLHGGLHVIVTFFSPSARVQAQAFGRAARQGEIGSAQLIFVSDDNDTNITSLYAKRDMREQYRMLEDSLWTLPLIEMQDKLLEKYQAVIDDASSPTGYRIEFQDPRSLSSLTPATVYVYAKNAETQPGARPGYQSFTIFFRICNTGINQDFAIMGKIFNVDQQVSVDISVAAASGKKNKITDRHYDLIHFALATNSLTNYLDIKNRIYACFYEKYAYIPQNPDFPRNISTLQKLVNSKYKDLEGYSDVFATIEDRELYECWQHDHTRYNNDLEIQQIHDRWAMWLRKNVDILTIPAAPPLYTDTDRSLTAKHLTTLQKSVFEKFDNFTKEIHRLIASGTLINNPLYLTRKAAILFNLESTLGMETAVTGRYPTNLASLPSTFRSEISSRIQFGATNYATPNLAQSPLGSRSLALLSKVPSLDNIFAWQAYTLIGTIEVAIAEDSIQKTEHADKAAALKQKYIENTAKAISRINQYFIPVKQTQLSFLSASKLTSNFSNDLAQQLIGDIKVYQAIIGLLEENVKIASTSRENQGIKIGSSITIEEITDKISYPAKDMTIEEIKFSGLGLHKLSVYALIEPEKSWWDTVFTALCGVAFIVVGVALSAVTGGAAGVFLGSLSAGLIGGGIADIIMAGIAVYNDTPLKFSDYLQSKAINLGITIATAGLLTFLDAIPVIHSLGLISSITNIGDPMKYLLTSGAIQGVTMAASYGISHIGRKMIDKDAILREAQNKISTLTKQHSAKLAYLYTVDTILENTNNHDALVLSIQTASSAYSRPTSSSDEEKIALGTAKKTANTFFGALNGVVEAATSIPFGAIKASETLESISPALSRSIDTLHAKAPSTFDLVSHILRQNFDQPTTSSLVATLTSAGYTSLSHSDCSSISALSHTHKGAVLSACNQVHKVFSSITTFPALETAFASYITSLTASIYEQEVVGPASDILASEITPGIVKLADSVRTALFANKDTSEYYPRVRISAEKLKLDLSEKTAEDVKSTNAKVEKVPSEKGAKSEHSPQKEGAKSANTQEKTYTPSTSTYRIKPGDTLSALAKKHSTNIQTLLDLNPDIRNPDVIYAGDRLVVPNVKARALQSFGGYDERESSIRSKGGHISAKSSTSFDPNKYSCVSGPCSTHDTPSLLDTPWLKGLPEFDPKLPFTTPDDKASFWKTPWSSSRHSHGSKETFWSKDNSKPDNPYSCSLGGTPCADLGLVPGIADVLNEGWTFKPKQQPDISSVSDLYKQIYRLATTNASPSSMLDAISTFCQKNPDKVDYAIEVLFLAVDLVTSVPTGGTSIVATTAIKGGIKSWIKHKMRDEGMEIARGMSDEVGYVGGWKQYGGKGDGLFTIKPIDKTYDIDSLSPNFAKELREAGYKGKIDYSTLSDKYPAPTKAQKGWQDHHIVSDKNKWTKDHDLFKAAGVRYDAPENKIFLPSSKDLHPTMSIHDGKHLDKVSKHLGTEMKNTYLRGQAENWTQQQYKDALFDIINTERQALLTGERILNKNARPWGIKQE